ncbi:MAG: hypothetical protein ACREQN_01060 [Candidatus Binataceae bacterium]
MGMGPAEFDASAHRRLHLNMGKRSGSKKVSELKETATGIIEAATQDVELTVEQARDAAHATAEALRKLGGRKGTKAPAKNPTGKSPVARVRETGQSPPKKKKD